MKILFLCHRFPFPPTSGGKIRAFHIIRHLHQAHEVTVASMVRSNDEALEGCGLDAYCTDAMMARVHNSLQVPRMLACLIGPEPSSFAYFHSASLARRIRFAIAANAYDLIVVHSSSVAHYVEHVDNIPKLLDFCDMDSQKWLAYADFRGFPLRFGYRLEGRKLEREEERLARRFDMCTTATRSELATLERFSTGTRTDWFPNGVDTDYFAPNHEPYEPDSLCFLGRMDYYPNEQCIVNFCRNVLPAIRLRRPAVKLYIVGADPGPAIRRLSGIRGVVVTGSVPDVRSYLRRSALMVAPLAIARGTQNKILEAMASGVPVVTSRLAAGGVDAVENEHLLVADTPSDVADATLRILNDPSLRDSLAKCGRARVVSHHSWVGAMTRLDRIIERVTTEFRPKRATGESSARRMVGKQSTCA